MKSTPPAAMSQTSLPSQTGPIAARTVRRSSSVRATSRRTMPTPKSKPSRPAETASIPETIAYQRASMVGVLTWRGRAALDLVEDVHDEEHAQQQVQPGKPQRCEDDVARVHEGRVGVRGAHQA